MSRSLPQVPHLRCRLEFSRRRCTLLGWLHDGGKEGVSIRGGGKPAQGDLRMRHTLVKSVKRQGVPRRRSLI